MVVSERLERGMRWFRALIGGGGGCLLGSRCCFWLSVLLCPHRLVGKLFGVAGLQVMVL